MANKSRPQRWSEACETARRGQGARKTRLLARLAELSPKAWARVTKKSITQITEVK